MAKAVKSKHSWMTVREKDGSQAVRCKDCGSKRPFRLYRKLGAMASRG